MISFSIHLRPLEQRGQLFGSAEFCKCFVPTQRLDQSAFSSNDVFCACRTGFEIGEHLAIHDPAFDSVLLGYALVPASLPPRRICSVDSWDGIGSTRE
jgi:hypothetical protein